MVLHETGGLYGMIVETHGRASPRANQPNQPKPTNTTETTNTNRQPIQILPLTKINYFRSLPDTECLDGIMNIAGR
jgi:hypothetical protein